MNTNQSSISIFKLTKYSKKAWTRQEDIQLLKSIKIHGMSNWSIIANDVPNRNGKQCRERYANHLSPDINHDIWNSEEDLILFYQQKLRGNQWHVISSFLPGRSPNHVKNRYNFLMSKKDSSQIFDKDLLLSLQKKDDEQEDQVENQIPRQPNYEEIENFFNEYFPDFPRIEDRSDDFFL
jgi:hypothetical protein